MSIFNVIFGLFIFHISHELSIGQRASSNVDRANETTTLDNYKNLLVYVRRMSKRRADEREHEILEFQRKRGKIQDVIPSTVNFPCDVSKARSAQPPTSVHRVRPGDVDIIAVLGDSLSSGMGIFSSEITHLLNEYRGLSFNGGGLGTWREFLTLPNILKVFNPKLSGYSTANELTIDKSSHLNIAEPMLMSRDLPYQTRILIKRMQRDPNIDMARHWKLVTIFVGNNDICSDMCHYKNIQEVLRNHELDMRAALTLLRDNVPRLIVNIMTIPHIVNSLYAMRNLPFHCNLVHTILCHCVFSERIKGEKLRAIANVIERWQAIDEGLAALAEFQTDDFTVIAQPFIANISLAHLPNGSTDLRFFAADCFHFSQLGHAATANLLWNNMMQPINEKDRNGKIVVPFEKFLCPTDERPYIATWKNSLEGLRSS